MSFSSDARNEVLKINIENDCCAIAFLSAIIKCSGQINISENGHKVVEVFTELKNLYSKVNEIIKQYYGEECEFALIEDSNASKNNKFKITLPYDITDRILVDLGILQLDGSDRVVNNGISDFIVADECCKRAYIMGAFISSATSNIVIKRYSNEEKKNSGYHLEFVLGFDSLAFDLIKLLEYFEIHAKTTLRKGVRLVYIKDYQQICDTLALVGASKAVLELQNEATIRDLRNSVNRQNNCLNANLTKTINASVKQLNAIKVIQENMGIEALDENLSELCLIRLANPDESLDNLTKLCSKPVTKSGINHRFSKIIAIADKIQKDKLKIQMW